jgi:hypothetical protein
VACKYFVLKIMKFNKSGQAGTNIDMYNLTLNGYDLNIPTAAPTTNTTNSSTNN